MISPRQISLLVLWVAVLTGTGPLGAYDIPGFPPDRTEVYKETTDSGGNPVSLTLDIFNPPGHRPEDQRPVVVFFFGGGWNSGSPGQFHPHCDYLASRGMVAISAEYRVRNAHGTTPAECVRDGKSAIRWIRENATTLGIDPNRIAAGGGSAGGQVAAATGTLEGFEEPGENSAISARPNALVLFNPVYDNGPSGYGHGRVSTYWEDFSPLHNIDSQTPPTVVFLGTDDRLIPVATARNFQSLMLAEGLRSDLHLYHDEPHSFFNYDIPDDTRGPFHGYQDTVLKTDHFLSSLGYLPEYPVQPEALENWITIFGRDGLADTSDRTASPTVELSGGTPAAIAAPFPEMNLADGDFIRLAGSVRASTEWRPGDLRLGIFQANTPVSAGTGGGYEGAWLEVPATSDTEMIASDGSALTHPFEGAGSTSLGPLPAASAPLPANRVLAFTLTIARNGDRFDLTTTLDDGVSFRSSQNLLNQPLPSPRFDRVALFMGGSPEDRSVQFSDLTLTGGGLLSRRAPQDPDISSNGSRPITYLDARVGPQGNTRATGLPATDLSWLVDPGDSGANQNQWGLRAFGNGASVFQALHNLPDTMPELTTEIRDLGEGRYQIWAFYWDQVESDTQNWILSAGLQSGLLASFHSPGEPVVAGATDTRVTRAADLTFTNEVLTIDGGGLRNLFGVDLGEVSVEDGGSVEVFLDNLIGNGSGNRAWFDGVGYARINDYAVWISGFEVGAETALADDPDGDGLPNGLENIFGSDPSSANAPGTLALAPISGDEEVIFTHPQATNPADDLAVEYWWSTDLSHFHRNGEANAQGLTIKFSEPDLAVAPGSATVTATASESPLPRQLFLRIAVSQRSP